MSEFNLSFTPLLPWAVLASFAALAVLVTALGLYRRRSGTVLRALGLALVLLALADPALVQSFVEAEELKEVVVAGHSPFGAPSGSARTVWRSSAGKRPARTSSAYAATGRFSTSTVPSARHVAIP